MPPPKQPKPAAKFSAPDLDFRAELWASAGVLRNNMDAAEYKHVVIGLIFPRWRMHTRKRQL